MDDRSDLDFIAGLLAEPTLTACDVGLPTPRLATDDEPGDRDGDEPGCAVPA